MPQRLQTSLRPAAIAVTAHTDLGEVELLWRSFEADALATPFQRFDWVNAFVRTIGASDPGRTVIVIAKDTNGSVMAILPLFVTSKLGLKTASFIGQKHANYHMPLFAVQAAQDWSLPATHDLLARVAAVLGGVDLFSFQNQPCSWRGIPNPFALLPGRHSPSDGYRLALDIDEEATLRRVMSKDARKKLRQKERRLSEMGTLSFQHVLTSTEVSTMLDAFLGQKARRFRQIGIPNPFASPATQAFLQEGCRAGLSRGEPAIELHALKLDDAPIAILGAAVDGRRLSGMFISFDTESPAARFSPGDLLVQNLISQSCKRGLKMFDLGVGEARYKSSFCDEPEPLSHAAVAVTFKGRLVSNAVMAGTRVKRAIKQNPKLWTLARAIQTRTAERV